MRGGGAQCGGWRVRLGGGRGGVMADRACGSIAGEQTEANKQMVGEGRGEGGAKSRVADRGYDNISGTTVTMETQQARMEKS